MSGSPDLDFQVCSKANEFTSTLRIFALLLDGGSPGTCSRYIAAHHRDEAVLVRAFQEFSHELRESHLMQVADLECSVRPAVAQIEQCGLGIDRDVLERAVADYFRQAQGFRQDVEQTLGIDPSDHEELRVALSEVLGVDLSGTGREALAPHRGPLIVDYVIKLRRFEALHQFASALIDAVDREPDWRVRGTFDQMGCATGRFTCVAPNLMAFPRDPLLRSSVVPRSGHVFIDADYRAIEMRVVAEVAPDARLRQLFERGGCPHRAMAALYLGKAEAALTSAERDSVKSVNFGTIYGQGPEGISRNALVDMGVHITAEQAAELQELFFDQFRGVRSWQRSVERECAEVVTTLFGRSRLLLGGETDHCARLASIVQGSAADGFKHAMVLLARDLPAVGGQIALPLHDENLIEVPAERATEGAELVRSRMIEGMRVVLPRVPVEVAVKTVTNWGEALVRSSPGVAE